LELIIQHIVSTKSTIPDHLSNRAPKISSSHFFNIGYTAKLL